MILFALLGGCAEPEPAPLPSPSLQDRISWTRLQPARVLPVATLPAEIVAAPSSAVVLAPPASGRILRWTVSPGDSVLAGQGLALMSSPAISAVTTRIASLRTRVTEQAQSAALAERAEEQGIISHRQTQAVRTDLAESRAALRAARSELASYGAQGAGESFSWKAPMAGVVGEIRCGIGSVTAERACLTIQHDQDVLLQVRIPERHLALMQTATTADFTSLSGRTASFTEIARSPTLDVHTRSLWVQYRPTDTAPLQGSSGRATVRAAATPGLQIVPLTALTRMDGVETVFVRGAEGPEPRPVQVHARDGEIAVVEGLSDETEVATQGVFLLKSIASMGEE